MKNLLDRHSALIGWLIGSIPLAVGLVGWRVADRMEQAKLDSQYVQIAIGILAKTPKKDKDGNTPPLRQEEFAVRSWAVRLLDEKSPQKFTDEEKKALLDQGLTLRAVRGGWDYDYNYDTYSYGGGYDYSLPPGQQRKAETEPPNAALELVKPTPASK